ncbi:MAG: glycosyltransferase family 2 protein [Lachnospiraceae bacterium]|nr:glycosyltransferase family 2 protein [Lachnospiraceae bacterium]
MDVSVIIPLYKGEEYVEGLKEMVFNAFNTARITGEIIFVIDDGGDYVQPEGEAVKVVRHEANMGIHLSRTDGFRESGGTYVHFLDQDDRISKEFYKVLLPVMQKADVAVANGSIDYENGARKLLYYNKVERDMVSSQQAYIYLDNRIISPGQCLIRRESVPDYWLSHVMQINGADDMLLWMVMMSLDAKFKALPQVLYHHTDTGENTSSDEERMLLSFMEMNMFYQRFEQGRYKKQLAAKTRALEGKSSFSLAGIAQSARRARISFLKLVRKGWIKS